VFSNLKPRILLVDDEPALLETFADAMRPRAAAITTAPCAEDALKLIAANDYDLVISDMNMPGTGGMELLKIAYRSHWNMALILISGQPIVEQVIEALRMGAADFLMKPITVTALQEAVDRNFYRLLTKREAISRRETLQESLERRTLDLERALHYLEDNFQATLGSLVAALDAREHETYAHSFRVQAYTLQLARLLGYPPALLPQLAEAALLHDIGKIGISDAILLKPAKLDESEFTQMKQHTILGAQVLKGISFLEPSAAIVRHHHERFDGRGYPNGLAGNSIPLGARIFSVADTLDAMTSNRTYRPAMSFAHASCEIQRCTGGQFDPRVTAAFLAVSEQRWVNIRETVESQHRRVAPPQLTKLGGSVPEWIDSALAAASCS